MKRLLVLCFVVVAVLALTSVSFGAVSENFNLLAKASYSHWIYNGFCADSCLCDSLGSTGGSGCGALPTRAVRFKNLTSGTGYAQLEYVGADSMGKDGGVGVISFDYKSWNTTGTNKITVSYQVGGGAYSLNDTLVVPVGCATWQTYTRTINNSSDNIRVRVRRLNASGTVQLHVDNFSITDYAPGAETDGRLAIGGTGAYPTISSLLTTEIQAQQVFTFNVRDEGTGTLNTIINGISIGQGTGNTAATWTQFIAGAKLTDGTTTWYGTVAATAINFAGAPLLTLPNGGAWQTLTLKIWLTNALPYTADNTILAFQVAPANFTTGNPGSTFNVGDAAVTSGSTNNKVDVVATRISITTQPPAVAYQNTSFLFRAGFTDMFGGIDNDFNESITVAVNSGTGVLTSAQGLSVVSTAGQSAWSGTNGLSYDKVEAGVVLRVSSPTYPTPVVSNTFTVWYAPSIVCDVAPSCWDKDSSDQAIPFALHITISNWLAEANHNVYVKMYDPSGANPWQYANGVWSKNTAYTSKPMVTLDANGSWAGWLPFKSKGMSSFKARAADVTTTGTNLTASSAITGTLLDFNPTPGPVTGVVLEDLTGYTRCTPGNVILAKTASGTVLSTWFAEDNSIPLDDGGLTIATGGFRMAVCPLCHEHVYFESWEPMSWPGAGTPDYTQSLQDFCVVAGEVREMTDIILPVNLISATATAGDASVTLAWTTASETSNRRFEIVRDGQMVKAIDGAVSSTSNLNYTWTDEGLTNGTTYSYLLRSVSMSGEVYDLKTLNAVPSLSAQNVTEYALLQNYPNPFNPTTSIGFDLVKSGFVSLKVYNVMGQEVASVVSGNMSEGRHIVNFDASSLSSGIYLYRIEANGFSAEKKMLLMK